MLNERLFKVRKLLGFTQSEMAMHLGYKSSAGYNMIEKGKAEITPAKELLLGKLGINIHLAGQFSNTELNDLW